MKVHAIDFLTHAKVERLYDATNFPEALILPGDHGFSVQLVCRRNRTATFIKPKVKLASGSSSEHGTGDVTDVIEEEGEYLLGDDETSGEEEVRKVEDQQGDNELESIGVHFVCPPNDPQVPLPCIHSYTEGSTRKYRGSTCNGIPTTQ